MLELIRETGDVKKIPANRLNELAEEIRRFMVETVSETGGHLASSLGVVELTIALHRVYDLPKDRLIWDVGHQTYTHKILTGRKERLNTLRKQGGLSGFPKRDESDCDAFDTGHSSNSVSAGLGYVKARDLTGDDYHVVSVIGDGAFTGGMAFEALNNAASLSTNFVVVLNDNKMSINKNVGGFSEYLDRVRTSESYTNLKMTVADKLEEIPGFGPNMVHAIRRTKSSIKQFIIPGMFFEDMGFTYLGPVDGHNIHYLEKVLLKAKAFPGPVLVHVLTEKGKGYSPAKKNPIAFHGVSAFKLEDGYHKGAQKGTFTQAFSEEIVSIAREYRSVVAITAAMKEGVGLRRFASIYPDRFFDVGIAEEHAVTFAAGLALGGMIPVVAIYSSFLQRGFDQMLMDVCAQKLHVVFMIDRAGFVGDDGRTHQGCFDLSYLSLMPEMQVMTPKDPAELKQMLRLAIRGNGPFAIRYSKEKMSGEGQETSPLEYGRAEVMTRGKDLVIWAAGILVRDAMESAEALREKGFQITVVNARFIKPFDSALLEELAADHSSVLVLEENVRNGGLAGCMLQYVSDHDLPLKLRSLSVGDRFVDHASTKAQRTFCGLDSAGITEKALEMLEAGGTR